MKWFASSVFWKASIVCSPSFCMERACGSVRVCNCGSRIWIFDHGTIIVREGKGSSDRALMLPESLAPSLREQLSRARAWWLKRPGRGPQRRRCASRRPERKYPRAGHSWPWFWLLRSTRIRPIHGAVSASPSHV